MCLKLFLIVLLCNKINGLQVLDNIEWTVRNANGSISIPAKVPGGIYSDLETAGVIGDILYRFNDVLTRWVAYDTWTYQGSFTVGDELNHEVANLVLHGVDTVAYVEVNDSPVGSTDNMFVRYVFDVKPHLKKGANTIKVVFASPIEVANLRSEKYFTAPNCVPKDYNGECHANQLRKMQASFAWDWGPAFPSVGFWKPVAIEFYDRAIIRSVTTHTQKAGQFWYLTIKAYLEANPMNDRWTGLIRADLAVEGPQNISLTKSVDAIIKNDGSTEAELNLTISENVVEIWWPNGYGKQPLYDLRISISNEHGEEHFKKIQVGFRTIELVEEDAAKKFGNSSAGKGLTFYFKVNGYPIFMKGSNWIPGHILPEKGYDREIVDGVLDAAVDAHMGMLRVWGGGVYESDYFYQRCDQLGLLIWQDFLFACSMYPVDSEFLDSVGTEIEQNVKRLQHHPSIAVWAGNNENEAALRGNWYSTQTEFKRYKKEYIKLYVDTIKLIVQELDPARRYLVSSPTNGLQSEAEGYIAENPYDPHFGDTHYYNYIQDNWDMNIYPRTRFASEYGFQSLPSLLTMESATKEKADFSLESDYSKHRQHSPFGYDFIWMQMKMHLKLEKNNATDSEQDEYDYFKKFVFYSQINQAMAIKAETEFYRQSQEDWYTMGALYWQINDVWQAPSWSSMDYQRRWKVLHYFAVNFFAPVLVSPCLLPSGDIDVYLINDRFVPIDNGLIKVDFYNWTSLTPISSKTFNASVGPLSAKKQDIKLSVWDINKEEIFLKFSFKAEGVESSPYNFVFPKPLKSIKGLKKPNIKISVSRVSSAVGNYVYNVDIQVDTIVLFLWLETPPILHSYFQENGLIITTPYYRTTYSSTVDVSVKELNEMITYQYYYED
ncbi:beta-mannosidase [Pectinophora gossypiella]|uniref:beta-mannosidase n=1 Tax=Pectinophora gossypiella TaxID=13191 RepID=UPI00214DF55F|nr:beta-mannosidase [Pectinophora gossypiella]